MVRPVAVTTLALGLLALPPADAAAQARPDLSGVWRLDPAESRLIGAGGQPARPSAEREITWLIDHRDPDIAVVVNVRDPGGSHEFSFRCTTDGRPCLNELPELGEVRHISAVWQGGVLVMTQRARSPHGDFAAEDRLTVSDSGDRLVFDRVVRNERGERTVRQVFRKLGPHPSRRSDGPEPLPSVRLPAELDRVLRDYERHWQGGDETALAGLFTDDGFATSRGGWVRGRAAVRAAYEGTSSPLRLRALAFAADDTVGYIVGAYGYGPEEPAPDRGRFILALRRGPDGRWLIAADLDASNRE